MVAAARQGGRGGFRTIAASHISDRYVATCVRLKL
jgi:hypothetical protein